jgi:hypothetical protein
MAGTRNSELEEGIDCRAWWSTPNRKRRANSDHTEFSERARRPPFYSAGGRDPLSCHRVVLMRWDQESDEHVDVEQADHD